MRLFISFQSFQTIKRGRIFQILFRSGILKSPEPQFLIMMMMLVLSCLVCLMIIAAWAQIKLFLGH
jgi:hypothetical protein